MQFFQTNLKELKTTNPSLASDVSLVKDVQNFEIFMDENDISTLNFVDKKEFIPLYEGKPANSIIESVQSFTKFEEYPYLYMYGIGNGLLVKHLLQNQKLKRIVIIEPEIEILHVVLHMVDFAKEIAEERVVFFGASQVSFTNFLPLFGEPDQQRYARAYDLHLNTIYYEKLYEKEIYRANQLMLEAIYHTVNLAGNDTKDALIGLKHHITNLPSVLNTPPLFELLNKLATCDTAILVSTGPSLTKQLPLLKKIAPFVRIIAVDASFPVLYKAGIKPDVVMSIERVKESARFFNAVPKDGFDDVIIGLSSLQHPDVINSIKGGTMQMSLRPLGYMTTTGPDEWGYLGIGMSSANMAFELIYHSNFKNCILIGQDLSYGEDGTSHAKGHTFGENEVKEKETDTWVEGWGGEKKVRTNHFWNLFKNFFEKDIAETNDKMKTINATEGGVRITGAIELTFAKAIEKYVKQKKPKKLVVLRKMVATQKASVEQKLDDKVEMMRSYIEALFDEIKSLFLEVAEMAEKINNQEMLDTSKVQDVLSKIYNIKAREKEPIYDKVVWHIAQSMLLVQDISIAPVEIHIPLNKAQEKEKMELLIESYKSWLFAYAGILDATLKTIDYAKARRLINDVKTIDVYLKDKKIDTITCHDFKANRGRVFDIDIRGILYDTSDAYQDKLEQIVFKDAKSGKELPRAFADVIARDDEKYNEISFMRSLDEPISEEIQEMYCPNAIGFLAIQENLEDEEFVEYINQIMQDFPNATFKALIFNNNLNELIKERFPLSTLGFIELKNINSLYESIEIYLSNYERTFANIHENNIVKILRNHSSDIACIGLGLQRKYISLRQHELENATYYNKLFLNLEHLGLDKQDIAKYGNSFHEVYFKKASEKYNVDINFSLDESMSKAYVYWNLKLGLTNHEFFKEGISYIRKIIKL